MNRRETLAALLALGASAASLGARAEQQAPDTMPVLAFLTGLPALTPEQVAKSPVMAKLREFGWFEGRNLRVERVYGGGSEDRLPELALELVKRRVDIIWTFGPEAAVAAARATTTIPIVFASVAFPVELGLIESFARPGRNVTGVGYVIEPEVFSKVLEFLVAIVPGLKRLAYFSNCGTYSSVSGGEASFACAPVEAAAKRLGVLTRYDPVGRPGDFDTVLPAIQDWRPDALLGLGTALIFRERRRIIEFANRNRLPIVFTAAARAFVDGGGLLSYGVRESNVIPRSLVYIDRILRGANPAELPVEVPSEYELSVNLKTARALGLTIPKSILLRADRVIE